MDSFFKNCFIVNSAFTWIAHSMKISAMMVMTRDDTEGGILDVKSAIIYKRKKSTKQTIPNKVHLNQPGVVVNMCNLSDQPTGDHLINLKTCRNFNEKIDKTAAIRAVQKCVAVIRIIIPPASLSDFFAVFKHLNGAFSVFLVHYRYRF
ncbi:hypothetical protein HMPREF9372_0252 [Sporosarcina newyorkensis 2681]|uniref:Uncharacterized protein n=1 Tax=Sporosarcina newyorkensis 2681 TaxID=1027292 RepID=F9DN72_9BACL|nr:hypothetical protein HMPREF9372_0252 [Sporosarcina newyorkensis 2681]